MAQSPSLTLKEIRPHGTKSFPCAIYHTQFTEKGTLVKHHWHEETEILYFYKGDFRLMVNMEQFTIHSECIFIINSGELHSIISENSGSSMEDAVVFHPSMLSFETCDAAQMQVIQPLLNGSLKFPRYLSPEHPGFSSIRQAVQGIIQASDTQTVETLPFGTGIVTDDLTAQLFIKSSLLRILAVLSSHQLLIPTEKHSDRRIDGIKSVLTYIKENYREKIYIRDLADLMSMNEQYFCRLFRKTIGRSPMDYVNEYRIRQAVLLLENTDLPVMDICLECGFNNLGNFLREFRKYKKTTPLQYRKNLFGTVHSHD